MTHGVRGVLLDFYGTVVVDDDAVVDRICRRIAGDTAIHAEAVADLWWQAFQNLCDASHGQGFRLQSVLARESLAAVVDATGSHLDVDELVASQLAYWSQPTPYEDALEFLDTVALPVVLVSDIDTRYLSDALARLGMSRLPFVTSEQVRAYKPRPDGFRSGLELLGLEPETVVHVGNSWSGDVCGAEAVGIAPIWVNRENRGVPAGARHDLPQVTGLDELVPLLRE